MSKVKVGDKAPNFEVKISNGETISLNDLKGQKVVVYFYPKDNTPGCTIEAKDFNELRLDIEKLGAKLIGISKDSLESHEKFKENYDLKFALGSDPDGAMCDSFGAWAEKSMFGKKYMGIVRSTFIIDEEGKIAHIWPKVSVNGHANEVLAKLREMSK